VYIYERAAGRWQARAMLKAIVPHAYDYLGDTLVLSGDVLLAGAPGQDSAPGAPLDDTSAPDSGGVFAFLLDDAGVSELGLFKLPNEESVAFPFPATLELSRSELFVAMNQAAFHEAGGETLMNAGRVYHLH
jgi:hypothetical protein